MTPKEKASELVDKFEGLCSGWSDEVVTDNIQAKQCALIAVDEIIEQVKDIVFNYGMDDKNSPTSPTHTIIPYLEQVKNEISKL